MYKILFGSIITELFPKVGRKMMIIINVINTKKALITAKKVRPG